MLARVKVLWWVPAQTANKHFQLVGEAKWRLDRETECMDTCECEPPAVRRFRIVFVLKQRFHHARILGNIWETKPVVHLVCQLLREVHVRACRTEDEEMDDVEERRRCLSKWSAMRSSQER